PGLPTGEVEVVSDRIEILNPSLPPPFSVADEGNVEEPLRLTFRYIDLRRPRMARNLAFRHDVIKFIRDFLDARRFLEVETPILTKSTPEGARDYLVPSRVHPGSFYALPQAPQQFKQLLMVAGVDRYFQIARCFRDEDLRADRQPEFTQLDLEMSFVEQEDILNLTEDLYTAMVREIRPDLNLPTPFPRLTYAECLRRFGTDKPDLRYGLELNDFTELVRDTDFAVFKDAVASGGSVEGICVPGGAAFSRREIDELTETVKGLGARGLVSIAFLAEPVEADEDSIRSPVLRYLGTQTTRHIGVHCGAHE